MAGTKDLGTFSDDIPVLGKALNDYALHVSGFSTISEADVTSATNAAKSLSGIATNLPETGGWLQAFVGEQNLDSFSTNIGELGTGLNTFATNIGGVDQKKTENALAVMNLIQGFTTGMDNTGGIFNAIAGFFGGNQNIVAFSRDMATVGSNLSNFANNIGGVSAEDTLAATNAMGLIQTFIGSMEGDAGFFASIGTAIAGGNKDIVGLSEKIGTFGTNFKTFSDGIVGAVDAETNFISVENILNKFKALSEAASGVNAENIATISTALKEYGTLSINEFSNGFTEGTTTLTTDVTNITNAVISTLRGRQASYFAAGMHSMQGLINGMNSMAFKVRLVGSIIAHGVLNSIRRVWDMHSPSRVAERMGGDFDVGLAGGLIRHSKIVDSSATDLGQGVVDNMSNILSKVGMVTDDIDSTPVIRPVLDMSDITRGVNDINGMFGQSAMRMSPFSGSLFKANAGALQFDGNTLAGSMSDKAVVTELQSLNERFNSLSDAVNNMKIVLDTGVLVGHTSARMDAQLGTIAVRKGRGN